MVSWSPPGSPVQGRHVDMNVDVGFLPTGSPSIRRFQESDREVFEGVVSALGDAPGVSENRGREEGVDGRPQSQTSSGGHLEVPLHHAARSGRHFEPSSLHLAFEVELSARRVDGLSPVVEDLARVFRRLAGDIDQHRLRTGIPIGHLLRDIEQMLGLVGRQMTAPPSREGRTVGPSSSGSLHQPLGTATRHPTHRL